MAKAATAKTVGVTTTIPADTDTGVEKKLGDVLRTCCGPAGADNRPKPRRVVVRDTLELIAQAAALPLMLAIISVPY